MLMPRGYVMEVVKLKFEVIIDLSLCSCARKFKEPLPSC